METILPKLEILDLLDENNSGWGPSTPQQIVDSGIPFQQFNKADRIGRVADWIGVDRFFRRGNERYNERVYGSAANAGSQFDYIHGIDENNFQLVDSSKPIQRPTQRNFRNRQLQFKKLLQKDQERKEQAIQGQNVKLKRSIAKEQQRAFKMWQRRGGNARQGQRPQGGRYQGDRPKERQPSVNVDRSWTNLEEYDFPRLAKLSFPNAGAGKEIDNHQYGTLHYYDKMMDRVSVKNPIPLQKCGGTLFNGSTSDDPIIQNLASQGVGNVFATDIILATLMSASRSVYSWDIVAERFGDFLFFDKRTDGINNPVDSLTVSETSVEPPVWEGNGINNAKDLATEALYINQNFRRQVLKRNEEGYKLTNPNMPFDDEIGDVECAYKYRKWTLGTGPNGKPVELICRTEHDGALMTPSGEVQMMTIKAFNEWDSSQAGGVDWRSKLDAQKGAVLATEIKNNNCKLAKWTIQALLANSDVIKFGYVSRYAVKNTAQHMILDTHTLRPSEFANNISLNMDNAWGVLRCIIDSLMKQPVGKYLLLKDPMSPVVRLFSVPENAFDGDKDDARAVDSDDDKNKRMRRLTPLLTVTRNVRRKAARPPPPQPEILEEGATFSDVHSVVLNPTTRLPYPEKELREHLEKTSREVLKEKNKAKYGLNKKPSAEISFDHIPIEEQIVLLFPGQGAQYVGMGSKINDCPAAKKVFEEANEILGYDLEKLCLEGPSTKLDQTLYCQPAVFVSSIAALEKLKANEADAADKITEAAGFSVGEFCALVASGMLSFQDALKIVKVRCEAMHECNQLVASGMMTVKVNASSRLEDAMKAAKEKAKEAGEMEICDIANYLYCGVRVIGATNLCLDYLEKHQNAYSFKVVKRLAVSGAFHTMQMEGAVEKVRNAVKEATLERGRCNVYSNFTGHIFPYKKSEARQAIFKQVISPVKWEQIQQVIYRKHQDYKFPRFIEVGPGRQLGAMLFQTSKKAYQHYEHFPC